jgi:hypothetical protein
MQQPIWNFLGNRLVEVLTSLNTSLLSVVSGKIETGTFGNIYLFRGLSVAAKAPEISRV